jgi:hypothetical protein
MDHGLRIFRAAMVGTTVVLCVTCVLIAGCAVKVKPFDFPAMKLTEPALKMRIWNSLSRCPTAWGSIIGIETCYPRWLL